MARVIRHSTGAIIGTLIWFERKTETQRGAIVLRGWRHGNGTVRDYRDPRTDDGQGRQLVTILIPCRSGDDGVLELLVPDEWLDYVENHSQFRQRG